MTEEIVERFCGNAKTEIDRLTKLKIQQQLEYEKDKDMYFQTHDKKFKKMMQQHEKAIKAYNKELERARKNYESCMLSILKMPREEPTKEKVKQKKIEEFMKKENNINNENKCKDGECEVVVKPDKRRGFWGSVEDKLEEKGIKLE